MKSLEFRSISEFRGHYFPMQHEKKRIGKMTPKEYVEYLARQVLEKASKILS